MGQNKRWFNFLGRLFAPGKITPRPSRPRRRTPLHLEALEDRSVPTAGFSANYAVTQDWGAGDCKRISR